LIKLQGELGGRMTDITIDRIERIIYVVRGLRVMLDSDLAELYGVTTKRLNEQVRRNSDRFPSDFVYQLTREERELLRSQFATFKESTAKRKYLPYVFTEQGVAMLSSVLQSKDAINVNVEITIRKLNSKERGHFFLRDFA
jgi:hypothetical protein